MVRPIRLLVAGDHVRIVCEDGQLLRALTLDSDRRSFGAATPVHDVLRLHIGGHRGIETPTAGRLIYGAARSVTARGLGSAG